MTKIPAPGYVRLVWAFVVLFALTMGLVAAYHRVKAELRAEALAQHCQFVGEHLVKVGDQQFCAREI